MNAKEKLTLGAFLLLVLYIAHAVSPKPYCSQCAIGYAVHTHVSLHLAN